MATNIISTTFRLKRGTAARWQELNLVLDAGEPGFELDTYRLKIGDGITAWNELLYIGYGGSGEGGNIVVDTILSDTSLNPIANKTVKAALDSLEALIETNTYDFGEGFKITEVDGIKTVEIDKDILNVDTENLATKEEVRKLAQNLSELAEAVAAIKVPTKISELTNDSEFITIKDVENKGYLTSVPEEYAKKSDIPSLEDYAKKSDIPSLEAYATKQYVQTEIEKIEIPSTDLSNYYTKDEVDSKDNALKDYVNDEISKAAIGGEIDLTAYAKKEYVDEQLQSFTPIAIVYGEF